MSRKGGLDRGRIDHVAFDFDGTLVRSNRIKRHAFYEATAGLDGAAAVLDELFRAGFRGDRFALMAELCRRLAGAGATAADPDRLAADYGRLCRARIAAAPEVPGARAALERLTASGARLYIVSATPQQPLEEALADRGLGRFFDRVLGAPTDKATHLRSIMEARGIGPSRLAMVGDGRDDLEAAHAVGCRFVAVTDEPKEALGPTDHAVAHLRDLPVLLGYPEACRPAPASTPAGR